MPWFLRKGRRHPRAELLLMGLLTAVLLLDVAELCVHL